MSQQSSSDRPVRQYHDGRSPAAWTGSITACLGFIAAAIGAMTGPSWVLVIIGASLVLLGGVATLVLKAAGYGQSPSR